VANNQATDMQIKAPILEYLVAADGSPVGASLGVGDWLEAAAGKPEGDIGDWFEVAVGKSEGDIEGLGVGAK
jgi:hypothetical protein